MSEYDESRSVSKANSINFKAKKEAKLKPGSLPWEEESMTFSRDKGALLLKLQRENIELRKKLKEFNMKLNEIIEQASHKKPPKKISEAEPMDSSETAKKKLAYYEKEYKRLEIRQQQLKDSNYEAQLKSEISTLNQRVVDYENSMKKKQANEKIRSKALEDVLETGEKVELYKEFLEVSTEINLYSQRWQKLQELNEKTLQRYKETSQKLEDLMKEYEKVKDREELLQPAVEDTSAHDTLNKAKKKHSAISGKYDSNLKILTLKVKKLEEDLGLAKKVEIALVGSLEKKNKEYQVLQLSLNDLQLSAVSNNAKKIITPGSFSDDYIFTTEKVF